MRDRQELQDIFLAITPNVYFQPPANLSMQYPCIVYSRDDVQTDFSGNRPYNRMRRYSLTVIDPDPDSSIVDAVGALERCSFSRSFKADDLNHDVFNLYY